MNFAFFSTCVALAVLPAVVSAQTVTVNKTDVSANFASITDALASFSSQIDSDNVIRVTDSAVYDEIININVPVTLEAAGTEKATLALKINPNGVDGKGGVVVDLPSSLTTATVVIRNFNIIPALETQGTYLMTGVENKNNNLFLWLDKIVMAPNDGANAPLVTDAVANKVTKLILGNAAFDPNVVPFGGDGVLVGDSDAGFFEGDGVELLVKDSVISHFRGDLIKPTATTTNPDAIYMAANYRGRPENPVEHPEGFFRLIRVEGEGGVSFARIGVWSGGGDVIVEGYEDDRLHMRGHSLAGVYFDGPSQTTRDISNVIIDGTSQAHVWDQGLGDIRMHLRNSILYYTGRHVLMTKKNSFDNASGEMLIENSTLVDGRTGAFHAYRWEAGVDTTITLRNSILAGKFQKPTDGLNTIWFSSAEGATLSIEGSAVVTTGPLALRVANPYSTPPTEVRSVINGDPGFLSGGVLIGSNAGVYDPAAPDFLNVTNTTYSDAADLQPGDGVTSAPLGGGAVYVGDVSAVADWELYAVGDAEYENGLKSIVQMHDTRLKGLKH